jgi:putative ABC transport system substrate-binding protein
VAWVAGLDETSEARSRLKAFREALAGLGWIEGRNIEITAYFGTADSDRNQAVVGELLRLQPDAITSSNPATISALMHESRTIPIVFTLQPDPTAQKFATSLARPGGNVTGFTSVEQSMAGKWLELLTEVVPGLVRVAMLVDPQEPGGAILAEALTSAASARTIQPTGATVHDDAEIAQVIVAFAGQPAGGLIVPPSAWLSARGPLILKLVAQHRLPAIYAYRYYVPNGGLMSYGPDVLDQHRRSASYVDRILKGAAPGDLPIQQPTKFELVVNLKTAKALGLNIPEMFLLRADEVIE